MALAFITPLFSYAIYAGLAAVWLIPDRRVEATLREPASGELDHAQ